MIKDMIKDPDKLLDEEMHWVRSGRVLNAGIPVPIELECATLLVHGFVHHLENSTNIILLGFLWMFHHVSLITYYTHFQSHFPSWNMEGRDESPKLFFLVTSPTQELSRSPSRVTSLEQKTILSPRI